MKVSKIDLQMMLHFDATRQLQFWWNGWITAVVEKWQGASISSEVDETISYSQPEIFRYSDGDASMAEPSQPKIQVDARFDLQTWKLAQVKTILMKQCPKLNISE